MNGKANKQQIQFPLKYNFKDDRIQIDSTFSTVDKLNSPTLNDMIQPLWVEDTGYSQVSDYMGNLYRVNGNEVLKNGESLGYKFNTEHFEKEDVTETFRKYRAFDINESGELGYLISSPGKIVISYGQTTIERALQGDIIEARCRWLNGDFYTVIYYDVTNTEMLLVYKNSTQVYSSVAQWQVQDGQSFEEYDLVANSAAPCIHLAISNGHIVCSLTTKAGTVNDLISGSAFITLVDWKEVYPTYNITSSYRTTNKDNVLFSSSTSTSSKDVTIIWNGANFYEYQSGLTDIANAVKLDLLNNYAQVNKLGTKTIGNVTYNYGTVKRYTKTFKVKLKGSEGEWYRMTNVVVSSFPNYINTNTTIRPLSSTTVTVRSDSMSVQMDGVSAIKGSAEVGFAVDYYSSQVEPTLLPDTSHNLVLLTTSSSINVSQAYIDRGIYYTYTYSTNVGNTSRYSTYPNVCLDDGTWVNVSYLSANTQSNASSNTAWTSKAGAEWPISGKNVNVSSGSNYYTLTITNSYSKSSAPNRRSASVVCNQNIGIITEKWNNDLTINPCALNNGVTESTGSSFVEFEYSSATGEVRYAPGTSRLSSFNYYSNAVINDPTIEGGAEDLAVFTVGGHRARLGTSNFYLLYDVNISGGAYCSGISYANDPADLGTLLTPWYSINEKVYVIQYGNCVIYKDKSDKWYKITVEDGIKLSAILEDSLIVINTTSQVNCYDPYRNKLYQYANDYNNRLRHGSNGLLYYNGSIATSASTMTAFSYIRYTADAINANYQVMPRDKVSSVIKPITARYRCYVGAEKAYGCSIDSYTEQAIDVYYSTFASTSCKYKYSLRNSEILINHNLQDLLYPGSTTTTASLTPNIFTSYLNGAGNNDLVIEGYDAYTLTYYDNEPYLIYSAATQTSNIFGTSDSFFCLQGQFYGIIKDKLYALSYSDGAIINMDCIIDLGSIQFLGNNPMIAFWWDQTNRVIKSFTGDNNLSTIFAASKFTEMATNGLHWYDETTQSIFVNTNQGLLVFADKSTYLIPKFKNVTLCQFSNDGITHITSNGITYNVSYYEKEGYEIEPVELETEFFGLGANEYTNIDRWDISLYDNTHSKRKSYLKVGVKSLTDISTKSEDKEYEITKDMFDKDTDYVLIRYVPKLQKGQGIKLLLETDLSIQKIVPHISDMGTGILTRRGL